MSHSYYVLYQQQHLGDDREAIKVERNLMWVLIPRMIISLIAVT